MIDYEGFKKYLEINLPKSANSYVSGLKSLINILNNIDDFKHLEDEEKIFKFLDKGSEYKKEFDKYHERNKDTFVDSRSFVKKYKEFLQNKNYTAKNENFYGLWIARDKDYREVIETGIWKNVLSNSDRIKGQLEKLKFGDKVFLFQSTEDVEVKDTPFVKFLTDKYNYMLNKKVVKVKSWSIGTVESVDFNNNSVKVLWDKEYKPNEWYVYFRQDGIWDFDLSINNKLQRDKYLALYDIVFNGKEQDYKWWIDNRIFERYKTNDNNFIKEKDNSAMNTKNIILYGPPGVGKTHNINKLVNLIEDGYDEREIFDLIKENAESNITLDEELSKRVKFITFHQSFGYEDFIEGFRPNEDGKIGLEDGIFKRVAKEAQRNLLNTRKEISFNLDDFLNDYVAFVEEKESYEIDDNLKIEVNKDSNGDFKSFIASGRIKNQSLTKSIIERDFEDFLNGKINSSSDIKPTFESNQKQHGNAPYYYLLFKDMKKFYDLHKEKYLFEKEELKNYYLIIDEINRGNISKIFGELITLIEESKRDNLEVILPYSKEPFRVPSNLFIIGTMNSTDKSIALIDIALRRRFTFLKMEPNEELVSDIAREYFIKLNSKIEEKLGSDFKIGHSYFMDINTQEDLDFIKSFKIKPLLEEYFYGDSVSLKEVLDIIV